MGAQWWIGVANWAMEATALLMTTIGALLLVLSYRELPLLAERSDTPQGRQVFIRHYRRILVAFGVVAASLVVQCVAMFFS
jgi:multisubunit Na+/H+ antiporter MnhB subunit